jgi:hypothetical protein
MTGLEFVNEVATYHTSAYLLQFVKAVRGQGWLSANREADELLEKLSLAVEGARPAAPLRALTSSEKLRLIRVKLIWKVMRSFLGNMMPEFYALRASLSRQRPPALRDVDDFDEWYEQTLGKRPGGFSLASAEMLDELVLLLEQVRANRRDWPAGETAPAAANVGAPAAVRD